MSIQMDFPMMLGVAGFALMLLAYIFALFGSLRVDSLVFDITNFVGAMLLVYYTYHVGAYSFSVLLLVWAVIAVVNMIKLAVKK